MIVTLFRALRRFLTANGIESFMDIGAQVLPSASRLGANRFLPENG